MLGLVGQSRVGERLLHPAEVPQEVEPVHLIKQQPNRLGFAEVRWQLDLGDLGHDAVRLSGSVGGRLAEVRWRSSVSASLVMMALAGRPLQGALVAAVGAGAGLTQM